MFVTFINFFSSHKSTLTTIEILVLSSWIPASKEFYLIMINQKQYLMKNAILLFTVLLIKEKSTYIDFTNDNRTLCFNTCPKSEKYNSNQHDVS